MQPSNETPQRVHGDWPRFVLLCLANFVGIPLAAIGAAMTTVTILTAGKTFWIDGYAALLIAVVAAMVSILTLPVLVLPLKEASLRYAIPMVIGGTWLVLSAMMTIIGAAMPALTSSSFGPVAVLIGTALITVFSVALLSRTAGMWFPRNPPPSSRCPKCRYELGVRRHLGCPECGWARTETSSRAAQ